MPERKEQELKKDDSNEQQKALISHFVGNWLLKATFAIEDGQDAQTIKQELVGKLEGGVQGTVVGEVLELIRTSDWSTSHSFENFRAAYIEFEKRHGIKH